MKLNLGAKIALEQLLERTGHTLEVADLEDIFKLNRLAAEVSNPGDVAQWDLLALPVYAGNVPLLQPTIAVILWLQDFALPHFKGAGFMENLVIGYALANAQEPERFWEISEKKEAKKAIRKWWRGTACTPSELSRGILRVLPDPETGGEDQDVAVTYGPVIALLTREYNGTGQDWLYRQPLGMIETMLNDWKKRNDAEGEAYRKTAASKGKAIAPPVCAKTEAIYKLNSFETQLEAKWATKQS